MRAALRVLVVDDHPVNRLVLTELLTHLGCDVTVAQDGAEALAATRIGDFDLICLDRHMPGLSGDDVADRMPPEQLVLAWSTDLSDLPERFNGVLAKPINMDALVRALECVTRGRADRGLSAPLSAPRAA